MGKALKCKKQIRKKHKKTTLNMRFQQPVICEFPTWCHHKLGVLPKCPCARYLLLLFFFCVCLSLFWGHPLLHHVLWPNNHFNGCSRLHCGLRAWLHHVRSQTPCWGESGRFFLPRSLVASFLSWFNIPFRMQKTTLAISEKNIWGLNNDVLAFGKVQRCAEELCIFNPWHFLF